MGSSTLIEKGKKMNKSYGGGYDNAGGHSYHTTASDGSAITVYVPGENHGSSGFIDISAPEIKHPLHGKKVTDGKVTGRLVGTSSLGKSAHIKVGDAIHVVDAKSVVLFNSSNG
jgi:hypothetical protein